MTKSKPEGGIELTERPSEKIQQPKMFVVFVHNDPITPREFVVGVLQRFFFKSPEQAVKIMMTAHTQGMAAAGIFTKEIAETKAELVNAYCREERRPLHFSVQEE